jgi:hypothetical protein
MSCQVATQVIEMIDAIRLYSIAVAPDSSLMKRANELFTATSFDLAAPCVPSFWAGLDRRRE